MKGCQAIPKGYENKGCRFQKKSDPMLVCPADDDGNPVIAIKESLAKEIVRLAGMALGAKRSKMEQ